MAQVNDMDSAREARYETPTFDPRGAFARTLRGGEMARLRRRTGLTHPNELAGDEPGNGRRFNGSATSTSRPRCYETPTFDPRGAFAWTQRSGEIARVGRQQQLLDPQQLAVLVGAS